MGSMSNPLDQWTPATVAAAQANRPRRYGPRSYSSVPGRPPLDAHVLGRIFITHLNDSVDSVAPPGHPGRLDILGWVADVVCRGQCGNYRDDTGNIRPDWRDYAASREDWSMVQHITNFGRVVQTLRQAVARIVRRAKWRRIIKGLRMQRYFEMSRPLAGPSSAVRGPNGLHIQ